MRRFVVPCVLAVAGLVTPTVAATAKQLNHRAEQSSAGAGKIPITTRSDSARALYVRARALNETLKSSDAHTIFEQAVALDSGFAMAEYYLASTAASPKEQTAHLRRALTLSDRASAGEQLMIFALQARLNADRARARQLAESLVVLYPNDERGRFVLGSIYAAQQRYVDEIAQYERAIAINPNYSLAYNQIGYAYRAAGNMPAAESALQRYIALIPNDPNPHDSYAELLMKMGRFDASIAEYEKALAIDAQFGASYIGIAANLMFTGRHGAALAELEKYEQQARNDADRRAALANAAMVYLDFGQTDSAIVVMTKSRAIADAAGDTASVAADASILGDMLLEAGRIDVADGEYENAHALVQRASVGRDAKADDALGAHYDAARIALARHQSALARTEAAAYATGAAERKNDARIRQSHELNARIALELKDFDTALGELARADRENPAVWYAMSRAEAGKGHAARAKQFADQALHMNIVPTFPYAFTRGAIASATGAASSRTARETPN